MPLRHNLLHQKLPFWLLYSLAFFFNMPLVWGTIYGYELCLAVLLSPLMMCSVMCALMQRETRQEAVLFVLAGVVGVTICLLMAWRLPDGALLRHCLSVILILFSVGFLFMGQQLAIHREQILTAFALSAAFALIITAAPNLLQQQPVLHTPNAYAELNVSFLGITLFGTFGVLSLAHLWCIQTLLCVAGMAYARNHAMWTISLVGFAAGVFLVLGSESRGALLCLYGLATVTVWYGMRNKRFWSLGLPVLLVTFGLPVLLTMFPIVDSSLQQLTAKRANFSTGRDVLLKVALQDIARNPFIGTGFRGEIIFENLSGPYKQSLNSSTHLYYLTLLWKGGVAFALPLLIILGLSARRLWSALLIHQHRPEFFVIMALAMVFGFLALTWDILMVPSAGALSYFLLGLFTAPRHA